MKYKVDWLPAAEQELADLWLQALGVLFRVIEDDKLVQVSQVWQFKT